MRIPHTDLTIPDVLYDCPLKCRDKSGRIYSTWKLGTLVNHIKNKHPEHFTTLDLVSTKISQRNIIKVNN